MEACVAAVQERRAPIRRRIGAEQTHKDVATHGIHSERRKLAGRQIIRGRLPGNAAILGAIEGR